MMNVIVVEPEKKPYLKSIPEGLESLQKEVGGYIEATYPFEDDSDFVCIISNEEGKEKGLPLNRAIRDEDGNIMYAIAGTFILTGLSEEDFGDIPSDLIDKYMKMFEIPEMFIRVGDKLVVLPTI